MTQHDQPTASSEVESPGLTTKADGKGWRIQLESGEFQEVEKGEELLQKLLARCSLGGRAWPL